MILAGDIGGTNTRLALMDGAGKTLFAKTFPSGSTPTLDALVCTFMELAGRRPPETGCLAVAGPVVDDVCRVTNLPWVVDGRSVAAASGIRHVRVINDFHAAALGVAALGPDGTVSLGGKPPVDGLPKVVMGPGTGLGVAMLIHDGDRYQPVPTEGGHRDFAPRTEQQVDLWRFLTARHGRVSYENVLSGRGLYAIYECLAVASPRRVNPTTTARLGTEDPAAVVSTLGMAGEDEMCQAAVDMFIAILGAEAGNLGLGTLARGGVYVAGGIAPRLSARLVGGAFRGPFDAKGQMADLASTLPAFLVVEPALGLRGAWEAARRWHHAPGS